MIELWMIAAGSNIVMVVVYGMISVTMLKGLTLGRQWRSNPLAVATAAIFVTCTLGHAAHVADAFLPALTGDSTANATQLAFSDPMLLFWDGLTAVLAIWYFTLRSRLALFFEGAALCADLEERHKRAQLLHDDIVQGLTKAKLALELGHRDEGRQVIADTLNSAKTIISDLLGSGKGKPLGPGDLRRMQGAA